MDVRPENDEIAVEAMWRQALTERHPTRWKHIPSDPRCKMCYIPFGGIGGVAARIAGFKPSRKNPNVCNYCDDIMPPGGAEVDIGVLFADVRGSTEIGERIGASKFATLLNRFYETASRVLIARDAMVDKLVGDEVMALFLPNTGPDYRQRAVESAEALMKAVGYGGGNEPWLPLAIGVNVGPAYVGKVGSEGIYDFTALGDTINTAARLQSIGRAGEIVLSEDAFQVVANRYPNLEQRTPTLRGKEQHLTVRVLDLAGMY